MIIEGSLAAKPRRLLKNRDDGAEDDRLKSGGGGVGRKRSGQTARVYRSGIHGFNRRVSLYCTIVPVHVCV